MNIEDRIKSMEAERVAFLERAKTGATAVNARPKAQWSALLLPFKLLRTKEDKGLGDTITRIIGPVGGDAFKEWHVKTFGVPCGCAGRQEGLNAEYPYGAEE